MALSFFSESEAPRDFRVSSTDSDEHYKKCLLCYTVKKNFYCAECVRTGNFVHSSLPSIDRFSEKQAKLLRLKANRKYLLERCQKLLANKVKKDLLMIEAKQCRDRIDLLQLAIEQRKNSVDERKKQLCELNFCIKDLLLKLPRYDKRVSSLGRHAQNERMELSNKVSLYNDKAHELAALRRSRIRQLTKYIFPVYMSYDNSDSIEDMEFLGGDEDEEAPRRSQLHIVAPWIDTDGDYSQVQTWIAQNREAALGAEPAVVSNPAHRTSAALALAAQLVALLAWTLDMRLPHPLPLSEYCNWRVSEGGCAWRARRLCACVAALCARTALPPHALAAHTPAPAPAHPCAHSAAHARAPPRAPRALCGLHAIAVAAATDDPMLGRVETWMSRSMVAAGEAWGEAWAAPEPDGDGSEPPEHLHWPEALETEEASSPPAPAPAPAPAPSLVTSAAASIASMWRGWTK